MKSFVEILEDVGGSDKNTRHSYGRIYDAWLAPLRDRPCNVMEAGVCEFGGGCVLALAEYFPNATIWAVEPHVQKCRTDAMRHPRIKFLTEDAYNTERMTRAICCIRFDVVIDDACHEIERQVAFLKFMSRFWTPDGFHVVEDCVTSQWQPFLPELHAMSLRHSIIDMATEEVPDNTLIRWDKV